MVAVMKSLSYDVFLFLKQPSWFVAKPRQSTWCCQAASIIQAYLKDTYTVMLP